MSGLVHDLRQPLSVIDACADYLNLVLPPTDHRARQQLELLQQQVGEANRILHEALVKLHYTDAPPEPCRAWPPAAFVDECGQRRRHVLRRLAPESAACPPSSRAATLLQAAARRSLLDHHASVGAAEEAPAGRLEIRSARSPAPPGNKSGVRNSTMLLDSTIRFRLAAQTSRTAARRWRAGRPRCAPNRSGARRPPGTGPSRNGRGGVPGRWHRDGRAARQQSQAVPEAEQMPWPNWVIFMAVQSRCGRAWMRPATTEVFPILRVCPPTTISIACFHVSACAQL